MPVALSFRPRHNDGEEQMENEHLLFRRGYFCTDIDLSGSRSPYLERVRREWETVPVGRFAIYHDICLPVTTHRGGDLTMVLLGTVVDPVEATGEPGLIAAGLHDALLESETVFFDRLDDLSGRFVIIAAHGDSGFALQDATGLKTLFYDIGHEGVALSSHASLLAELLGYEPSAKSVQLISSSEYRSHARCFPGLYTPYPRVRMLTPNTLLDLSSRQVRRFYPRRPLQRADLDDSLVEAFSGLMRSQVEILARRYPLSVSITGGFDSRVTLAATTGNLDRADFFTYVEVSAQEREAEIAGRLCAAIGGRHSVHRIDESSTGEGLEEYMRVWRVNTAGMRAEEQGLISKVLYERYPADHLHLKSVVSPVGKATYRHGARGFLPRKLTPAALGSCYQIQPRSPFVLEAFSEYMNTTGFSSDAVFNFDFYDIFFWEFRSGVWVGVQTIDFDTSMDTFALYNNRRILEMMLSLPLRDRLEARLHRRAAAFMCPDIEDIPYLSEMKPWHVRATKEVARSVKYSIEGYLESRDPVRGG